MDSLSATGRLAGLTTQMVVVSFFPTFLPLFAAAASVSKAQREVQSEAAVQAASTLALEYNSNVNDDPIV
jgi:hypothetical protein